MARAQRNVLNKMNEGQMDVPGEDKDAAVLVAVDLCPLAVVLPLRGECLPFKALKDLFNALRRLRQHRLERHTNGQLDLLRERVEAVVDENCHNADPVGELTM